MRPRPFALCTALALAAGAVSFLGCRERDAFPQAPVIVISIDTLRADRLPAYGYEKVETPALDRLRADAILCERAYSHYPMTLPSHVSLLTGQLPPVHGVRDNVGYPFRAADHPYLPRLFKEAGYATGAAVSSYVLRADTGLGAGFDFYEDRFEAAPGATADAVHRRGDETARLALDWIRPRAREPFFFFFHIYEPHFPYEPQEPFAARYADRYDGEVATSDKIVGDFLEELRRLGVYDKAVIVLTSDHGEGLGDHGEYQHAIFVYRETIQVPLMIKLPGSARGGSTVEVLTQLADVFPTLAQAAGLPVPGDSRDLVGASILDLLAAESPPERQTYSESWYARLHYGWSELTALRGDVGGGSYTYIDAPEPELYDVAADPGETRNILSRNRRAYGEMRQAIRAFQKPLAPPAAVDAETRGRLAALGYAGATVLDERGGPRPDPKSRRPLLRQMEDAWALASAGDHERAVETYRAILATDPQMVDIWELLATSLRHLKRHDEALEAYRKALELSGGASQIAVRAAAAYFDAGRLDEARRHAELALQDDPQRANEILVRVALARGELDRVRELFAGAATSDELRREVGLALAEGGRTQEALEVLQPLAQGEGAHDPAALTAVAVALTEAGRPDEALRALEQALALAPEDARAHQQMGVVLLRLNRPAEARDHLRRALAVNDQLAVTWNTLGVALYQLEGPVPALAAWQRSVALDPRQYQALYNLGLVAASTGRLGEARGALRQFVDTAPPQQYGADIQKARGILREIGG
ncbi:MAG TPA: tetratricopeptide repeat protein [Thermoanaerobaculia bacterium]|nr:tetratricopeptide repeat protein [Thermoanaerobaculia bacterium]